MSGEEDKKRIEEVRETPNSRSGVHLNADELPGQKDSSSYLKKALLSNRPTSAHSAPQSGDSEDPWTSRRTDLASHDVHDYLSLMTSFPTLPVIGLFKNEMLEVKSDKNKDEEDGEEEELAERVEAGDNLDQDELVSGRNRAQSSVDNDASFRSLQSGEWSIRERAISEEDAALLGSCEGPSSRYGVRSQSMNSSSYTTLDAIKKKEFEVMQANAARKKVKKKILDWMHEYNDKVTCNISPTEEDKNNLAELNKEYDALYMKKDALALELAEMKAAVRGEKVQFEGKFKPFEGGSHFARQFSSMSQGSESDVVFFDNNIDDNVRTKVNEGIAEHSDEDTSTCSRQKKGNSSGDLRTLSGSAKSLEEQQNTENCYNVNPSSGCLDTTISSVSFEEKQYVKNENDEDEAVTSNDTDAYDNKVALDNSDGNVAISVSFEEQQYEKSDGEFKNGSRAASGNDDRDVADSVDKHDDKLDNSSKNTSGNNVGGFPINISFEEQQYDKADEKTEVRGDDVVPINNNNDVSDDKLENDAKVRGDDGNGDGVANSFEEQQYDKADGKTEVGGDDVVPINNNNDVSDDKLENDAKVRGDDGNGDGVTNSFEEQQYDKADGKTEVRGDDVVPINNNNDVSDDKLENDAKVRGDDGNGDGVTNSFEEQQYDKADGKTEVGGDDVVPINNNNDVSDDKLENDAKVRGDDGNGDGVTNSFEEQQYDKADGKTEVGGDDVVPINNNNDVSDDKLENDAKVRGDDGNGDGVTNSFEEQQYDKADGKTEVGGDDVVPINNNNDVSDDKLENDAKVRGDDGNGDGVTNSFEEQQYDKADGKTEVGGDDVVPINNNNDVSDDKLENDAKVRGDDGNGDGVTNSFEEQQYDKADGKTEVGGDDVVPINNNNDVSDDKLENDAKVRGDDGNGDGVTNSFEEQQYDKADGKTEVGGDDVVPINNNNDVSDDKLENDAKVRGDDGNGDGVTNSFEEQQYDKADEYENTKDSNAETSLDFEHERYFKSSQCENQRDEPYSREKKLGSYEDKHLKEKPSDTFTEERSETGETTGSKEEQRIQSRKKNDSGEETQPGSVVLSERKNEDNFREGEHKTKGGDALENAFEEQQYTDMPPQALSAPRQVSKADDLERYLEEKKRKQELLRKQSTQDTVCGNDPKVIMKQKEARFEAEMNAVETRRRHEELEKLEAELRRKEGIRSAEERVADLAARRQRLSAEEAKLRADEEKIAREEEELRELLAQMEQQKRGLVDRSQEAQKQRETVRSAMREAATQAAVIQHWLEQHATEASLLKEREEAAAEEDRRRQAAEQKEREKLALLSSADQVLRQQSGNKFEEPFGRDSSTRNLTLDKEDAAERSVQEDDTLSDMEKRISIENRKRFIAKKEIIASEKRLAVQAEAEEQQAAVERTQMGAEDAFSQADRSLLQQKQMIVVMVRDLMDSVVAATLEEVDVQQQADERSERLALDCKEVVAVQIKARRSRKEKNKVESPVPVSVGAEEVWRLEEELLERQCRGSRVCRARERELRRLQEAHGAQVARLEAEQQALREENAVQEVAHELKMGVLERLQREAEEGLVAARESLSGEAQRSQLLVEDAIQREAQARRSRIENLPSVAMQTEEDEEVKAAVSRGDALQADNEELRDQVEELQYAVESSQSELEAVKKEFANATEEHSEAVSTVRDHKDRSRCLALKLEAANAEIDRMNAEMIKLSEELAERSAARDDLENQCYESAANVEGLQEQLSVSQREKEALQASEARLKAKLAGLRKQLREQAVEGRGDSHGADDDEADNEEIEGGSSSPAKRSESEVEERGLGSGDSKSSPRLEPLLPVIHRPESDKGPQREREGPKRFGKLLHLKEKPTRAASDRHHSSSLQQRADKLQQRSKREKRGKESDLEVKDVDEFGKTLDGGSGHSSMKRRQSCAECKARIRGEAKKLPCVLKNMHHGKKVTADGILLFGDIDDEEAFKLLEETSSHVDKEESWSVDSEKNSQSYLQSNLDNQFLFRDKYGHRRGSQCRFCSWNCARAWNLKNTPILYRHTTSQLISIAEGKFS